MKFQKLLAELQRRNVLKATIAYLAVAWVIIQIASIILPAFDAPEFAIKIVIYLLAIGLVFWVGFSWIYDLTPQGIQKTETGLIDEETSKLNNRRLNQVIIGALTLAVVLLVIISFWAGAKFTSPGDSVDLKRIAVLPLTLLNEEKDQEYFQAGMTEALIKELSKVDQLQVISPASTKYFTSGYTPANLLIAKELKRVDYFVEGTISKESNQLKVSLQLKENLDSDPAWQKHYSRDISQARSLWAEVASDLTSQMRIEVSPEDRALWLNLRPVKPETYELYLKGKHYLTKSKTEDWQKGMVYLQEAIDHNPADPFAYAGLAEGYITLGHNILPSPDVFPKAQAAAKRAIQLDSTCAEGWAALAHYHTYFGWDWQLAEYAFNKANQLNPNMAYNHYHRSWYLALFGRMNEAINEHKIAQELDPFTPLHTAWLAELYRMVGEYDLALAEADKAAKMEHDYALSMFIKGRVYLDMGRNEEALAILKRASEINWGWKYMGYGPALLRLGYLKEGKAIIEELEAQPPSAFGALCLSEMYFELGDFDKGFEWLNYKKRHAFYAWIRVLNTNEKLRNDPRFLELIRSMNLPDPAPLEYVPEA